MMTDNRYNTTQVGIFHLNAEYLCCYSGCKTCIIISRSFQEAAV